HAVERYVGKPAARPGDLDIVPQQRGMNRLGYRTEGHNGERDSSESSYPRMPRLAHGCFKWEKSRLVFAVAQTQVWTSRLYARAAKFASLSLTNAEGASGLSRRALVLLPGAS